MTFTTKDTKNKNDIPSKRNIGIEVKKYTNDITKEIVTVEKRRQIRTIMPWKNLSEKRGKG